MKLIIKQYLSSLNERNELDVLLPDLLSQMGFIVFSRPGRGTRQDGVDVAAVGSLDGGAEKVYLFSIKAGDLTRQSWNGNGVQSLRPSIDSILDAYISNRLPNEHRNKDIVICLCFGGDIQEQVRTDVKGYFSRNQIENLTFEEWNGDKLATLILTHFLHEDLMPKDVRGYLRKAIALLDEPKSSFQHFSDLVNYFSNLKSSRAQDSLLTLRQINICLWILFAWSRDLGNIESAYLSAELSILHSWNIAKEYLTKNSKIANSIQNTFNSLFNTYSLISSQYIAEKILPHVDKKHGLSSAIGSSCSLDINLKMFDILGRLAISGIWEYWYLLITDKKDKKAYRQRLSVIRDITVAIKKLILNNPTLFLPIKDNQTIDISIAVLLLFLQEESNNDIQGWLSEMMNRARFSHLIKYQYPCTLDNYGELLEHPQNNDEYYKEVTPASILYPMIAFWATLLNDNDLYDQVKNLKEEHLSHCNFQLWYPDETSESFFYNNQNLHGAVLPDICVTCDMEECFNQISNECKESSHFKELSAVKSGLEPLIIVACRHYRLPLPLHLWEGFIKIKEKN